MSALRSFFKTGAAAPLHPDAAEKPAHIQPIRHTKSMEENMLHNSEELFRVSLAVKNDEIANMNAQLRGVRAQVAREGTLAAQISQRLADATQDEMDVETRFQTAVARTAELQQQIAALEERASSVIRGIVPANGPEFPAAPGPASAEEEAETWAGLAGWVEREEEGVRVLEARVAALVAVARTHWSASDAAALGGAVPPLGGARADNTSTQGGEGPASEVALGPEARAARASLQVARLSKELEAQEALIAQLRAQIPTGTAQKAAAPKAMAQTATGQKAMAPKPDAARMSGVHSFGPSDVFVDAKDHSDGSRGGDDFDDATEA
mmetsp:Transcript_54008/g.127899  ORF Transcript_54008/g.127899 Transcript_54008/m.127899 type:complete len:324 (-) Transcript_54008:56-1027(-)